MEKIQIDSLYYLRDEEIRELINKSLHIKPSAVFFGNSALVLKNDGSLIYITDNGKQKHQVDGIGIIKKIAAGKDHAVMLTTAGKVFTVGSNALGQCNVKDWKDVADVFAGDYSTLGILKDNSIVFTGKLEVSKNTDTNAAVSRSKASKAVTSLATGENYTLLVYSDGTVTGMGDNIYGQLNVSEWTNICQVAAGNYCTVGLKNDGTVITTGKNTEGQCNTHNWKNIKSVASGYYHTVGLKKDGTVQAVGRNDNGQCNVSSWTNIRKQNIKIA